MVLANTLDSVTNDALLERQVTHQLRLRHVPSLRHLAVQVRGGAILIRGRVGSFYEKQLIHQVCREVAATALIVDRVVVHRYSSLRREDPPDQREGGNASIPAIPSVQTQRSLE